MVDQMPQSLRSDAQHNRDQILAVAREAFRDDGLGVTMRDVARRSGVGIATLYRRFPTKEALITEAFKESMTTCQAIVEDGLNDPDPWRGFCTVVKEFCVMHALDRGFTAAFMTTFPDAIDFTSRRDQALRRLSELARRARSAGQLREDFVIGDLLMVFMANGGIATNSPKAAAAAARRFAALQIEAFRRHPANATLPPPAQLAITIPTRRTAS